MGLGRLRKITELLRAAGRPAFTPVAVIARATSRQQTVVRGTLGDIAERARGLSSPATIVVGEVSRLADRLGWFAADGGGAEDSETVFADGSGGRVA